MRPDRAGISLLDGVSSHKGLQFYNTSAEKFLFTCAGLVAAAQMATPPKEWVAHSYKYAAYKKVL
jgi:hypothetical protein